MKLFFNFFIFSLFFLFSLGYSEILTEWEKQYPPENKEFYDVLYNKGMFYAVGSKGIIINSTDGINWKTIKKGEKGLIGITYGKGKYVAVGEGGTIQISTDGKNWQKIESGISKSLMDVTYANGTFVAVGENGNILYSSDGIIWKKALSIPQETFFGVKYITNAFYATGTNSTLLKSTDGKNWQKINVPLENPRHFGSIAYGKGKWIMCGSAGRVFISSDMKTWQEKLIIPKTYGRQRLLIDILFAFDHFIVVGQYGIIAISSDGEKWKIIQIPEKKFLMRLTNSEDAIVAVGLKGAIYKSTINTQPIEKKPKITIDNSFIDFGVVQINNTVSKTVSIRNSGEKELLISSIKLIEDNKSFSIEHNCSSKLKPYESCQIEILFSPDSEGDKNSKIEIHSNDPDFPTVFITAVGIGAKKLEPDISVSKDEIIFDKTYVGDEKSQNIIITNKGYAQLKINDIISNNEQFTAENNCKTIQPLNSCLITVIFQPKYEGSISGKLKIVSNDPDTPQITINLKGESISTKNAPYIEKNKIDFGEIPINTEKEEIIYVMNLSKKSFNNLKIELHQKEKAFYQENTCDGISLKNGDECKITVMFKPLKPKEYQGEIRVTYDSGGGLFFSNKGSSIIIPITGKGYEIIDKSTLKSTKFTLKNGKFINPPEVLKKINLPSGYKVLNELSFKYDIALLKEYDRVLINVKLPVEFNPYNMEVFLCKKDECKNITSFISVDTLDKKLMKVEIADGGELDFDGLRNQEIESSLVIAKQENEANTDTDKKKTSSSGGCFISQDIDIGVILITIFITFLFLRRILIREL